MTLKEAITSFVLLVGSCSFGADYAVTFYKGDLTGIPDGWPKDKRELAQGEQVKPGETFVTEAALAQIMADRAAAMDARNAKFKLAQRAHFEVIELLKQRLSQDPWQEYRIDALQTEFLLLLVNVVLNLSEQEQLLTKAVAASALTNNLTAPERARVAALKAQLTFPAQDDITAAQRSRAVAIRDGLVPHWRLYTNAVWIIQQAKSLNPVDPKNPTNWPSVTVGD